MPGSGRFKSKALIALSILVIALTVCAMAIVAWRLRYGPQGSYFTFGYIGDEYAYAQRMQPLIAGTSAANTINRYCDTGYGSLFFLEDGCRAFLSITGIHVISFMWAWRLLSPLLLALGLWLLTRQHAIVGKGSRDLFSIAVASFIFPLLICSYDLMTRFPPLQGFIQRIPTNLEYPLSILAALTLTRFLSKPTRCNIAFLALAGAIFFYLRLYTSILWAILSGLAVLYLLLKRRLQTRTLLTGIATLTVALLPLALIYVQNASRPVHAELLVRYFGTAPGWRWQCSWKLLVGIAAAFCVFAVYLKDRVKILLIAAALALIIGIGLPNAFIFSRELLLVDRYGCFYLVCGAIGLTRLTAQWFRHSTSANTISLFAFPLAGLVCACTLAYENSTYNLMAYPLGPLSETQSYLPNIPACQWIEQHTPADALFIVDDVIDWSSLQEENFVVPIRPDGTSDLSESLFPIVARRQCLYDTRLFRQSAIRTDDLNLLMLVHRATFGLKLTQQAYYRLGIRLFKPSYIFWRKPLGPRGFGLLFANEKEVVYEDDACVIWKIDIDRAKLPK